MKTGVLHFDSLPAHFTKIGLPKDIPITEGQHSKEIDVAEDKLDPDVSEKMRAMSEERMLAVGKGLDPRARNIPVGFDAAEAEKAGGTIIWDDDQ